ncbi:hypothetical protein TrRE_jg12166 [Triparma retinervis]|uniref:Uncharacterized protein n=1 Tax=Triparma retinervis TaxID=2557542 RepID=A0A9W7E7C4_9STRA|nr:hypothetical protein TrRE_jg12166 [Triparma retinervis]
MKELAALRFEQTATKSSLDIANAKISRLEAAFRVISSSFNVPEVLEYLDETPLVSPPQKGKRENTAVVKRENGETAENSIVNIEHTKKMQRT